MSYSKTRRNPLRTKPLILAGLIVSALACATLPARAQTQVPAQPGAQTGAAVEAPHAHRGMESPNRPDPARMEAQMAQRTANLKAKLKIEPAQEAAWSAWSATMKPPAGMREAMAKNHEAMNGLSTPERIDRMKALRARRDAEMDKRAEATKTFYAQLNADQKGVFDSMPMMGARTGGHGQGHEGHGSMMGHG